MNECIHTIFELIANPVMIVGLREAEQLYRWLNSYLHNILYLRVSYQPIGVAAITVYNN